MNVIFHKRKIGTVLESTNNQLILIVKYSVTYQRISVLNLNSLKIEYSTVIRNGKSTSLEFYKLKLFVSNNTNLKIFSNTGEIEQKVKKISGFSNGLYFKKEKEVAPKENLTYEIFSIKNDIPLFKIEGGYWNKIYSTTNLIIVKSKFEKGHVGFGLSKLLEKKKIIPQNNSSKGLGTNFSSDKKKPTVRIFSRRTGEILNEFKGESIFNPKPYSFDDSYCYFLSTGKLIKVSQSSGEVLWSVSVEGINNVFINKTKLIISKRDGLFELNEDNEINIKPIIRIPKKLKNNFESYNNKRTKIGYFGEYFIGILNDSHTAILLISESNQTEKGKIFMRRNYKEQLSKGISNFFFIENKMIVSDFDGNVCIFNINEIIK